MIDANTSEVLKSYLPPSFNTLEYQVVAEEDIALGMKELLMFALTVNTNLKLSTGILFCQGIINNKLANAQISASGVFIFS